jgi:hypothetical protein
MPVSGINGSSSIILWTSGKPSQANVLMVLNPPVKRYGKITMMIRKVNGLDCCKPQADEVVL